MAESKLLRVGASLDNLARVRDFVEAAASELGASDGCASDLQLAVDEAVTNVVMHGYRGAEGEIEILVERKAKAIVVRLRDRAAAFDQAHGSGADLSISPLEQASPGGYGLHLIRGMVDESSYRLTGDGRNELVLVKNCSAGVS